MFNPNLNLLVERNAKQKLFGLIPYRADRYELLPREEALRRFSEAFLSTDYPIILIHPDKKNIDPQYHGNLAYVFTSITDQKDKAFTDHSYEQLAVSGPERNVAYLAGEHWGKEAGLAVYFLGKQFPLSPRKPLEEITKHLQFISKQEALQRIIPDIRDNVGLGDGTLELPSPERGYFVLAAV